MLLYKGIIEMDTNTNSEKEGEQEGEIILDGNLLHYVCRVYVNWYKVSRYKGAYSLSFHLMVHTSDILGC